MALDIKKIIKVAKDRAMDELIAIVDTARRYSNLDENARIRVRKIAHALSLRDDYPYVITALDRLGFINGEEDGGETQLKKGMVVIVTAGPQKGAEGEIKRVDQKRAQVLVEIDQGFIKNTWKTYRMSWNNVDLDKNYYAWKERLEKREW